MPRKISPSQLRSLIRQQEAKQKQALNKVKRAVDDYNRKVKRAVDDYNRAVRTHNSRVRNNRRRIQAELSRFRAHSTSIGTTRLYSSSQTLYRAYDGVVARTSFLPTDSLRQQFSDLTENEMANSLAVVNVLSGEEPLEVGATDLRATTVTSELERISADLDRRWQGALYSLSPSNPDAARHFCASTREIFIRFLDLSAPDDALLDEMPNFDRTNEGKPTRRSRIKLLLQRKGLLEQEYEEFVAQDVENVLDLFQVLNEGTHGTAGRFPLGELATVKERVEDAIRFLGRIAE